MLIWYFSNNLDIYDYVGKLPEEYFSLLLFSNPGDKILFLMKFNEARISEWNVFNATFKCKPLSYKICIGRPLNLLMYMDGSNATKNKSQLFWVPILIRGGSIINRGLGSHVCHARTGAGKNRAQ